MRLRLKVILFTGLVCLLLSATNSFGQSLTTQKTSTKNKLTKATSDIKLTFPNVEGWDKSAITTYPYAELGYSINYESEEGGRLTVYVYNGGKTKIPTGSKDKIIKDEIDRAKFEIYQVEIMGKYKDVKELKSETVNLGGLTGKVESLHSLFSFTAGKDKLTSDIFLFGYQNHFIKIRATRMFEKEGTENQMLISLLKALDKLFSGDGELIIASGN